MALYKFRIIIIYYYYNHQAPEWTILRHVNSFIQGEVLRFQVLLNSPLRYTRTSQLLQLSGEKLLRSSWHLLRLAFVQCAQTQRQRRRGWNMADDGVAC